MWLLRAEHYPGLSMRTTHYWPLPQASLRHHCFHPRKRKWGFGPRPGPVTYLPSSPSNGKLTVTVLGSPKVQSGSDGNVVHPRHPHKTTSHTTSHKLFPRFFGLFTVIKVINSVSIRLSLPLTMCCINLTFHVSQHSRLYPQPSIPYKMLNNLGVFSGRCQLLVEYAWIPTIFI